MILVKIKSDKIAYDTAMPAMPRGVLHCKCSLLTLITNIRLENNGHTVTNPTSFLIYKSSAIKRFILQENIL